MTCGLDGFGEQAAAHDGFADKRDQGRVVGVVIERVAVGDPLDDEPTGTFEDARISGLLAAV
jgi:hypothetical protein